MLLRDFALFGNPAATRRYRTACAGIGISYTLWIVFPVALFSFEKRTDQYQQKDPSLLENIKTVRTDPYLFVYTAILI